MSGVGGADLPAVVATRQAVALGRRADLRTVYRPTAARGVHVIQGADPRDPDVRAAVAVAAVPDAVTLGGWAAARRHEQAVLEAVERPGRRPAGRGTRPAAPSGPPVFDGVAAGGRGPLLPVLVLAPPEVRLTRVPGRRLLRSRVLPEERVRLGGTWTTAPLRTAFDLARTGDEEDAVVGLDRLRALGLLDAGALAELLDARRGWRGVRAARRALALSADGVESPQESRLRLRWVAAGLPPPLCNPVVLDGSGRFVGRVDLLDEASGLVGEYDGAVHAAADRRAADARRQELLHATGLEVVRATSADLADPASRARWEHRLLSAHARACRRRPTSTWRLARP